MRRTRWNTKKLPAGWTSPAVQAQAQAMVNRYAHQRAVNLERRIGIRRVV